tara:strand:+ start:529 stop:1248 length:720 start_codon:yes stop_codon:yes gene_type:complete
MPSVFRDKPEKGFDIQELLFAFTLESFAKIAFGLDLGCLSSATPPPFGIAFDASNIHSAARFSDPFWELKKMFGIGREAELAKHIRTLDDFVFPIIKERRSCSEQSLVEQRDFLSQFMKIKDGRNEKESERYLRDLVINFLLAGRDTTASSLTWTCMYLAIYPEVRLRILQEVRQICHLKKGDLVTPPSYDQLKDMHYLHAAVSESMRLKPPVPADGKIARRDDRLPSGTEVKVRFVLW